MKYKMVVLDVDGTLLTNEKTVTARTRATLIRVQQMGIKVVLASGRPTYGVVGLAKELELDKNGGYILSYNGGQIINVQTNELLFEKRIDPEFIPYLERKAQKNGFFVMEFDWRSPLNVSLQWCEDVMNTDVLAKFARFTGPVLAIAGTQDTAVNPEWSTKIKDASHNPKSKTVFIEGMEHTFNVFSEPDFASLYIAVDETGSFFADTL